MTKRGTALAEKFPEILYVGRETDDVVWFDAADDIERFDDSQAVAVYRLVQVSRKQVEHTLV